MPRTKKSGVEKVEKKAKKIVKKKAKEAEKGVEKVAEVAEKAVEQLGEEIGKVTHYFGDIGVAVVELAKDLKVGDLIRIKGVTADFIQKVESMQVEHEPVKKAEKGKAVGLKVKERVRGNEKVYLVKK